MMIQRIVVAAAMLSLLGASDATAQRGGQEQQPMTFFITSVGLGSGANLGGLAGADAYCQKLATAAGRGNVTWRAYLSTQGANAVNARDRIGNGPWYSATGRLIARDLAHLHGDTHELARMGNGLHEFHAVNEKGDPVNGVMGGPMRKGPNMHDILTGSTPEGRAYTDGDDHTCSNWTSGADGTGSAQVGHHDRIGPDNNSWNSSHGSRGCNQANLARSGGAGLFYCFAVN